MSEEAQVEAAKAEDIDPDALFKEFGDKEREADPNAAKEEPEDKGQATDRTPEGQADTGTPPEDAGKTPPASTETADIWKDVPEPARKAFEESEAARLKAENVAKAHGGRLAQAYTERDALNAKLAEAGKAAGPKAEQEGDETDADYRKRMKDEFPEFQRYFDRLDAQQTEIDALKGNLDTVQTTAAATQTEAALEEQERVFTTAHPNWEAEKKDPAIQKALIEWANVQPPYVQDALRRNAETITDGPTAADLISRFKRETAHPAKEELARRREEQLEAGKDTRASSPAATKTGAADNDTDGLWNEFRAADAKKAAGDQRRR